MEPELRKLTIEVMDHLSPTEWKSTHEIADEISKTWKKQGRRKYIGVFFSLFTPVWFVDEIVRRPNYGSLYVAFEELEAQGLAESRWRSESPATIAKRRNLRLRERKLTEQGHRVKARLTKTFNAEDGALVPKHA